MVVKDKTKAINGYRQKRGTQENILRRRKESNRVIRSQEDWMKGELNERKNKGKTKGGRNSIRQ